MQAQQALIMESLGMESQQALGMESRQIHCCRRRQAQNMWLSALNTKPNKQNK